MRKNQIKDAARKLFSDKGYYGCSMQEIASAVGINKATLYFYFESKAMLFFEVLDDQTRDCLKALKVEAENSDGLSIKDAFFQLLKVFADNHQDRLLLWKSSVLLSLSEVDDDFHRQLRSKIAETDKAVKDLILMLLHRRLIDVGSKEVHLFLQVYRILTQGVTEWILIQANYTESDGEKRLAGIWEYTWKAINLGDLSNGCMEENALD